MLFNVRGSTAPVSPVKAVAPVKSRDLSYTTICQKTILGCTGAYMFAQGLKGACNLASKVKADRQNSRQQPAPVQADAQPVENEQPVPAVVVQSKNYKTAALYNAAKIMGGATTVYCAFKK